LPVGLLERCESITAVEDRCGNSISAWPLSIMRTRHLNGLLVVAILLISTAPLYAQRQQQNVAKFKTDVRNAVGIIGGDKAKTQTYCQIVDLGRQKNQAVGEKDQKKARALAQEIVQLRKQLPEFVVLENVVNHVDLNSPDGREIALIIQSLNQSCGEE
jgi:beta-phosphoglucomutase-like phosphatase (HAD superfamily)